MHYSNPLIAMTPRVLRCQNHYSYFQNVRSVFIDAALVFRLLIERGDFPCSFITYKFEEKAPVQIGLFVDDVLFERLL